MQIAELLQIGPGVTAIIGGGGKTTLMRTLAEELRLRGTVLICTSTHIRRPESLPFAQDADALSAALKARGIACAGAPAEDGKLATPAIPFEVLAGMADFVIAEADGSRGLPLKAHASHEPVIPASARRVILVLGADGFGQPIREVCHRPALYAALAGVSEAEAVTPALCARVLNAEGYGDAVYVNKAETPEALRYARELAALVPLPVWAGSLHRRECLCLS